ncbi:iron ABC transporter substrate-binding protein [Palaeococcus sp. (in: euryarchaeotes)]
MKRFLALFVGLLLITSLSGCIQTKTNTSNSVKIVDTLGREVEVPANVEKIVATGPGALRIIVYLNATDRVVGVEDFEKKYPYGRPYAMAHPELRNLTSIGPGGPGKLPNLEALINLKPDVIFMTYVDTKTADDIQEKTGIPVVVLSYGTLETFEDASLFKSLELAGKILGKEKRANEVISFIKSIQNDLEKRAENAESPTAYIGGIGYKGAHGIESTKPAYPAFKVLNVRNVAGSINQSHVFIDKEKLLEWNPEFIFLDEGGLKLIQEDYSKSPDFYNSLKAFKEGNIYGVLPYNFYSTNIGTAVADAYFIGKVLYPKRFEDVDPKKKADEIYNFLVGKPVYKEIAHQFGGFGRINLENGTVNYSLPISP